jgi:hypothetical protein
MSAVASPTADRRAFCQMPPSKPRVFAPNTTPGRMKAIINFGSKWVNETTLRYYLFDGGAWKPRNKAQTDTVRKAFDAWKGTGLGLRFEEVSSPGDAEIRIGFENGDGSWSYLGRDVLNHGPEERTMNFGWDIANDVDTAIHEIGHTLGLPHEHQSPFAGITWNEEAVYTALAAPPNRWDRETTHWNIIRKLDKSEVKGTNWDPNSIMHYPFDPGMILQPKPYDVEGVNPKGGLSALDVELVKSFYPSATGEAPELRPFASQQLHLEGGQQANFTIRPASTRTYNIATFGESDSVMVLFEKISGNQHYITADDDSGTDNNAKLTVKLTKGREYTLRLRLYHARAKGELVLLMW